MRNNHEIDYKIYGEELQFVEVELDPQETVIGEPGGFMMMEDGIEMQTISVTVPSNIIRVCLIV